MREKEKREIVHTSRGKSFTRHGFGQKIPATCDSRVVENILTACGGGQVGSTVERLCCFPAAYSSRINGEQRRCGFTCKRNFL